MKLTQELKDSLTQHVELDAITMPVQNISEFTKNCRQYIYKGQTWVKVSDTEKQICLSVIQPYPQQLQLLVEQHNYKINKKTIVLTYDDLSYNEALEQLMPIAPPQGFETIGRIAHFNLHVDHYPYKYLVGQVLLDKNKLIDTVCNKTVSEKLHNVYRTPTLELLAGKPSYDTVISEGGLKLSLNFEQVYWCTRLYSERERILSEIKRINQGKPVKVLDLFCGIGPFALRMARDLNAVVVANDLNPYCYKYLQENINKNKLQHLVTPLNKDARQVVLDIYDHTLNFEFNHVYMNLPVLALDFLDVFRGFTLKTGRTELPYIHVYGFAKGLKEEELIDSVTARIIACLPGFKKEHIISFHVLKNVTKMKKMVCTTFQLDKCSAETPFKLNEVPKQEDSDDEEEIEQPKKKVKV